VRRFGTDTLDVIEHHPERLRKVEGIGPKRAARIVEAWRKQRDVRDVMLFLHSNGVTPAYAARIYRRYGRDAIATIKADPYVLAREIHGIGFKLADRIARKLGIRANAPERIRAGVLHALDEAAAEGHCFVARSELEASAAGLLGVAADLVGPCVEELRAAGVVVIAPAAEVSDGADDAVYPQRLHVAETRVARRLAALLEVHRPRPAVDARRAVVWAESRMGLAFAEAQRKAIATSLGSSVSVITGGPGTGKTTIVRALSSIVARKGGRVALAAPTGRAAKRLSEAARIEAATIHRLLRYSPREGGFQHGVDRPLDCDLLVVDETSMVDVVLMDHLLAAVPPGARLVLVGDADQLPSVGPGNVLGDVLRSGRVPSTRLSHIFRQAGGSLIVANAHRIDAGRMPVTTAGPDETQDFFVVEREEPGQVLEAVLEMVTRRIPRRWHLHPVDEVQVLTPMHRGPIGARNLNAELAARLNPGAPTAEGSRGGLRLGDKVMQVRNNYELDVYNGDIGRVARIDDESRSLWVDFDGRHVEYAYQETDELLPAYAISIHKSQGSEFPAVVVLVSTSHYVMLQRNLLYTAVTRGRRLVVVVGSRKAMGIALSNDRVRERHTALDRRLRSGG
jgi:exodeoxyribonuclease V alpha subunit